MQAYIELQGKQFKVEKGSELEAPRVNLAEGDTLTIDKVLAWESDGKNKFGTPYIKNAKVTCKVLSHTRSKKMLGAKFKRRKGYTKIMGSRTLYSILQVESIDV